jgi:hypothetical protein
MFCKGVDVVINCPLQRHEIVYANEIPLLLRSNGDLISPIPSLKISTGRQQRTFKHLKLFKQLDTE